MRVPIFTDYENIIKENEYTKYEIGKNSYINFVPMGFDIETSTVYLKENEKVVDHFSYMYTWQFSINDIVLMGRTWEDFSNLLNIIKDTYCYDNSKTIIFICNQSFEFSFMGRELQKLGHTVEVFARKQRKPMKITIDDSIICLDTYLLTNLSLSTLAKNYCKTQKLKDFDYNLVCLPITPLTRKQIKYCMNDVLILSEYAIYYAENYLSKKFMPMTGTMIANRVVKDKVKDLKAQKEAYYLVKKAYPKNFLQYNYIMSFYSGAYTHGNLQNLFITSTGNGKGLLKYDVCSLYPYELCSSTIHYYPIGKFHRFRGKEEIRQHFIDTKCCLLDVTFHNLKTKKGITILSKNKVLDDITNLNNKELYTWDNGRCFYAKNLRIRITEVDLKSLALHYTWDSITYHDMLYANRGTLPKYYVQAICDLYKNKSLLKHKKDTNSQLLYRASKSSLNGQYGALCTRITQNEIIYNDDGWNIQEADIDWSKMPMKKLTLCQWAIYCTSWSRNTILEMIAQIKNEDFYYSDTDSLVLNNKPYIHRLFNKYNKRIREENKSWVEYYNLDHDVDYAEMGTFDLEHDDIIKFKCLGSKRYLTQYSDGRIECTVAGLPKDAFIKHIQKNHLEPFEAFSDNLLVDCATTEKLTTYYCDNEVTKTITDYQGRVQTITSASYVSLIPTTFKITVADTLKALNIQFTHYRDIEGVKV